MAEVDIHLELRSIDELVTEERNFASGTAQFLRCSLLANLKPLLQRTSSTAFAKHIVPSAGPKNSGNNVNACSGPSFRLSPNLSTVERNQKSVERKASEIGNHNHRMHSVISAKCVRQRETVPRQMSSLAQCVQPGARQDSEHVRHDELLRIRAWHIIACIMRC